MKIIAAVLVAISATACAKAPSTPSPPVATRPPVDACGAAGLQSYVGKLRSELPALDAARTRIVCTTCPVTRDFRPDRLNVFFEESTQKIAQITCG